MKRKDCKELEYLGRTKLLKGDWIRGRATQVKLRATGSSRQPIDNEGVFCVSV